MGGDPDTEDERIKDNRQAVEMNRKRALSTDTDTSKQSEVQGEIESDFFSC